MLPRANERWGGGLCTCICICSICTVDEVMMIYRVGRDRIRTFKLCWLFSRIVCYISPQKYCIMRHFCRCSSCHPKLSSPANDRILAAASPLALFAFSALFQFWGLAFRCFCHRLTAAGLAVDRDRVDRDSCHVRCLDSR